MTEQDLRQTALGRARHLVVKMGTQLLTGADGHLDLDFFHDIAGQIAALRQRSIRVTLVSSGAIGAGCAELGLARRPADITEQQAVASVGQRRLMTHYHEAFAPHGLKVAQLLLTREDFDDRVRFLNIRNCISRLHELGCVPIANENDTVSVDELRFGDNDLLAALMTNAVRADALVLLSVVDGLLDAAGRRVETVRDLAAAAELDRHDKSSLGTGGMSSKLEAVRLVTQAGEPALIANGRLPRVLPRLVGGDSVGTLFVPVTRKLDSRKRWIGLTRRPDGAVRIDEGAAAALVQRGKSLLAGGIQDVTGDFEKGGLLAVCDSAGREIGRGLSNYSAVELRQIMGKKSSQFEKILGRPAYAEVIHRDNLVISAAEKGA